ncbi:hypothetical protein OG413_44645 [Streptomyces sp. NBC_01433]|uniref:hypothetical protein n=1 Tax=Streptomyces sp. NBC_01433 TaxID=2903864 RepID=UPI002258A286|nr:hypothetical protein [Streptomyces sp. NBC_01433]MCX4682274.1 hypothetical protein [Streptomyces sp. NBC_01433]
MLATLASPKATHDPRIGPLARHTRSVPVPFTRPFRPHPGFKGAPQDAEAERLLHLFHDHFAALGHELMRCQLELPAEPHPLAVDLLDLTTRRLIVGRGTAERSAIHEAIGELLDLSGLFLDAFTKTLLLPQLPDPDLGPLLKNLGITVTWPTPAGWRDSGGRTA